MSVFRCTTPQPPSPTDKPDIEREAQTLRSVHEVKRVVDQIVSGLDPFDPTFITTADGQRGRALFQHLGNEPVEETATYQPFQLVDASDDDGLKVRVVKSLLANQPPSGFSALDDLPFVLDVTGTGVVYACVTFDASTGLFTSRTLGFQEGDEPPGDDPDSGTYYTQIGTVFDNGDGTLACSNDQYGPIKAATYRKWFAYPKQYGFAWT